MKRENVLTVALVCIALAAMFAGMLFSSCSPAFAEPAGTPRDRCMAVDGQAISPSSVSSPVVSAGTGNFGFTDGGTGRFETLYVAGTTKVAMENGNFYIGSGSLFWNPGGTIQTVLTGGAITNSSPMASTVASGSNAFQANTNGARFDFGAGASDYASSDGTTVTFAGPVTTGNLTAQGQNALGNTSFANTATVSFGTNSFIAAAAGNGATWKFGGNVSAVATAPTISSGFCTSPTVTWSNGTAAFQIDVGSACASSTGTLGMPAATNGWMCHCINITTAGLTRYVLQAGAGTTTTVPLQSVNETTGVAVNWTAGDDVRCLCMGG